MPELDHPGQPELPVLDIRSGDEAIDSRLNTAQMLSFLDGILPFEACLFYQVIPLSLEKTHLNLGMVNPGDQAAVDYVRQQVSYINVSVVAWPVPSDWHRRVLSQYLSYAAQGKAPSPPSPSPTPTNEPPAEPIQAKPLMVADEQMTFIVDSPDEITLADRTAAQRSEAKAPQNSPEVVSSTAEDRASNLTVGAPQGLVQSGSVAPGESASRVIGSTSYVEVQSPVPPAPKLEDSALQPTPPLHLDLSGPAVPPAPTDWHGLPPKRLIALLLHRVITQGIGRLFFERQPMAGRVVCSHNGVVQSVLNNLNLDLFQSLIDELKQLTHLPLEPTTQNRQVEIERFYRQEKILLRFQLMVGTHGEEATVQVLRGSALRFYQQQQLEKLGYDALGMAQNLQKRIMTIRDRFRHNLSLDPAPIETLSALKNLIKDMETQLDPLIQPQNSDQS